MAKKRFTDGLSNLFDNPFDEPETPAADLKAPNLSTTDQDQDSEEESIDIDIPVTNTGARKKLSSKGFTSNLDSFLSGSFEREAARNASTQSGGRPQRRKSGLDLLIRSTVQEDDEDRNPAGEAKATDTKRVTLIFRKDHLTELKELAKERNVYLKDLVQEMVAGFLEEGE